MVSDIRRRVLRLIQCRGQWNGRRLTTSESLRKGRGRVNGDGRVDGRRLASVAMVVVGRLEEGRVGRERLKDG